MADDACTKRTGGQALTRQLGGQADRRTGWKGCRQSGGRGRKGRGQSGGRVDEGVDLGLKGHIPPTPFHSLAPSPLALSEHGCVGCLGVQWSPG